MDEPLRELCFNYRNAATEQAEEYFQRIVRFVRDGGPPWKKCIDCHEEIYLLPANRDGYYICSSCLDKRSTATGESKR